jgi:hypothetical protein
MNRLAPLVPHAPVRSGPARAWAIDPMDHAVAGWSDDARLFLTAFVGGLIFFGTFFA